MKRTRTTNVIAASAILFACVGWPAHAQEKKERTITTTIEVSIRSTFIDGTSNTVILGSMAMKVDDTGAFTGDITPAKDALGNQLPGIVFRGSDLYADPSAPQSLNVRGQLTGSMIAFTVSVSDGTSNTMPFLLPYLEQLPTIIGTGMTTADLTKADSGPMPGIMAGTASVHTVQSDGSVRFVSNSTSTATWAASSHGMSIGLGDGSVRGIR